MPDWFANLYQGSYRSLVLTAYAMTNDIGSAEEITQEAWIRTVVVNLAHRRRRRRAMLDRILRRQRRLSTDGVNWREIKIG